MSRTAEIIHGIILPAIFFGIVVWVMICWLKRSENRVRLIMKWLVSVVVVYFMFWRIGPLAASGSVDAAFAVPLLAVCGIVMAITWRHSIAGLIAKPFSSLFDGGNQELEPQPLYSMAQARRKRGYYNEAVAEIWKQLEKFPTDFDGQLLLAEIQAENLNDLPGAEVSIRRLCNQPGRSPKQIALALNFLADWHLKFNQDREAARQALETTIEMFPDTDVAALASQRIAHLASTDHLLAAHGHRRVALSPGVENIGLLSPEQQPKAPETDPANQAAELVQHLHEHPLDTEARERLAVIYADDYGQLNLAADQLEQLITHPHQPGKRVVHWLNLLADIQVRHGAGYDTVRETLQRIIDLYPNFAAAQTARNRIDHLRLELKGKQEGQTVRLGTYEQDIGLKNR